jgi:hypothetical protein
MFDFVLILARFETEICAMHNYALGLIKQIKVNIYISPIFIQLLKM